MLRCLPYFHILGVDKCGTTDLYSRIAQHPHVLLNSGKLGKETGYWCWRKYGEYTDTGFEWYSVLPPEVHSFAKTGMKILMGTPKDTS